MTTRDSKSRRQASSAQRSSRRAPTRRTLGADSAAKLATKVFACVKRPWSKASCPETPAPMPVQPAPIAPAAPQPARSSLSMWDRIVAFFTGGDVSEPASIVVPPAPVNPRPARSERGQGEHRRGRGNGDGRRDSRRDCRRDGKSGERRDGRRKAMPARARTTPIGRPSANQAADERRPAGAKPDGRPRRRHRSQDSRGGDEAVEKRKPRSRPEKDKSIVAETAERVTMPEDIGPSPSIAAVGALVTADLGRAEAPRAEGQEDRGRRRRRRRGRGGRGENGADVTASGNGNALAAERNDDEPNFAEQSAREPTCNKRSPSSRC